MSQSVTVAPADHDAVPDPMERARASARAAAARETSPLLHGHRQPTSGSLRKTPGVLALQRALGNQATQRLLGQQRPAAASPTVASPMVQRRALIGPALAAPSAGALADAAVAALHQDAHVRRFATEAELQQFASQQLPGMGMLPGTNDWVRLDAPMTVLGENHGNPQAPAILQATRIRNYRYEGYTHHSQTRQDNSPALRDRIAASATAMHTSMGLAQSADEPTHDAEHALAKYARVLPDVQELIDRQNALDEVGGVSVVAGAALIEPYSLAKALLNGLLNALVYAQSYGEKFFGHRLKRFYKDHRAAVDAAIVQLSGDLSAQPHPLVTDFSALAVTPQLDDLAAAYEALAKDKLGMTNPARLDAFKQSLQPNAPNVTLTDAAKELDFLRDKSMFDTIKRAARAGDRLFVIGDAHRHKLQPLLDAEGIVAMPDGEFVDQQKQLNRDAGGGVTADAREALNTRAGKINPKPRPVAIGATFSLDTPPDCQWDVTGATATGAAGTYTVTASTVTLTLIWTVSGIPETIRKLTYSNLRRPGP